MKWMMPPYILTMVSMELKFVNTFLLRRVHDNTMTAPFQRAGVPESWSSLLSFYSMNFSLGNLLLSWQLLTLSCSACNNRRVSTHYSIYTSLAYDCRRSFCRKQPLWMLERDNIWDEMPNLVCTRRGKHHFWGIGGFANNSKYLPTNSKNKKKQRSR